jgi:adenylate cyclase class 2
VLEIELKLFLETEERARQLCSRLGLPWREGTFEVNRLFDYPDRRLRAKGALVRVRERGRGDEAFLTYKQKAPQKVKDAKVRLEHEAKISSAASVIELLRGLGLRETLFYERYRARHELGAAHLEIDRLPGGWFCEIEGSPEEISRVRESGDLGTISPIAWSYPEIFARITAVAGGPRNWSFEAHSRGELHLPRAADPFWLEAATDR